MLSEFARTVVSDAPIRVILDDLVLRVVELLPIDCAGVTIISLGHGPREMAASDAMALRLEGLQTKLGAGPCVAAFDTNSAVLVPDIRADERFPSFTEHSDSQSLAAVFTFPLREGARSIGALDLYRTTPGRLGTDDQATAQTFADVASAYLLNARARQELIAATKTERRSLAKFREMDKAKAEFMASVIHELRTPMTSISGYTELLVDDTSLSEVQRNSVNVIGRNCRRLKTLADDLLTLASFEPGAYSGRRVDVDYSRLVVAVSESLEGVRIGRDLRVTIDLPVTPVTVWGDAVQLERMMSNLMFNAVKFTEDGGWIRCALWEADGRAVLEISDSGIGIPLEEQPLLFHRFFRSSTAHQHSIQGSGLGLAIAQATAHSHQGEVTVTSSPGQGSTFRVDLPTLRTLLAE